MIAALIILALAATAPIIDAASATGGPTPAHISNHGGGGGGGGGGGPGSTPVAFQGSALLITYYSGASWALRKGGVIKPGKTVLAGLSGGGYTAVANALEYTGPEQLQFWKDIILGIANRFKGSPGYINAIMQEKLWGIIPSDVRQRLRGKVRIALSQLDGSTTRLDKSASWVVSDFANRNDLIAALTTTNHIPCFASLTTYGVFRNQPVIDGGYGNGYEELCPGGNTRDCIKVASWHVGPLGECPAADCPNNCRGEGDRLDRVKTLHKNDKYADRWRLNQVHGRCPPEFFCNPDKPNDCEDPYHLPLFVPQDSTAPDIHPGKYNPLPEWKGKPLLACEWQAWAGRLPIGLDTEPALELIYEQGYKDARSYLEKELNIVIEENAR